MDKKIRGTLLRALQGYRGDDLARAKAAFRRMTPAQMLEEHGESGKTRQQVLDDYQLHDDEAKAAIAWVEAQP